MNPDSLSGSLKETVDQINAAPVPGGLAQRAIEQAATTAPAAVKASRPLWRFAGWSALAASICVVAFGGGILMTRWTQPRETPIAADAPVSTAVPLGTTVEPALAAGGARPAATPTQATSDMDITLPRLLIDQNGARRIATGVRPGMTEVIGGQAGTTGWTSVTPTPATPPVPMATGIVRGGTGVTVNATANATTDADGNITGITITNPGRGYTSPPTITVNENGVVAITAAQPDATAAADNVARAAALRQEAQVRASLALAQDQMAQAQAQVQAGQAQDQAALAQQQGRLADMKAAIAQAQAQQQAATGNTFTWNVTPGGVIVQTPQVAGGPPLPPEVQKMVDKFDSDRAVIVTEINTRLADTRNTFIASLQQLQTRYANAGQSDNAAAIQQTIARLQAQPPAAVALGGPDTFSVATRQPPAAPDPTLVDRARLTADGTGRVLTLQNGTVQVWDTTGNTSAIATNTPAQPDAQIAPPVPVKTGALSGKILDKDGKPAANALVQFGATPPSPNAGRGGRIRLYNATTDQNGEFTIKAAPVGTGNVSARLIGAEGAQTGNRLSVEVKEGLETKLDAEIKLQPAINRGGGPISAPATALPLPGGGG